MCQLLRATNAGKAHTLGEVRYGLNSVCLFSCRWSVALGNIFTFMNLSFLVTKMGIIIATLQDFGEI